MNYFLGIDIAKTNHVASLINNNGDVVIRAIKFTNSNEGFNKLLNTIQSKLGDLSNIEVAMEATGHYWLSLYSALTDNNFNVSVYNPYQIKSYRGAYNNRKQKNDIIDSIIIADYLRVFGSKESKFPEEKLLSLKQLTRFRANIVANVSSLKVQVIGLLDKVFPEYKKLFCDTFGNTSKQLLLNCPTPDDIINISTTKLANLLSKNSKGRFNKDTALHIKEVAKSSFGIKFTTDACSFEIKQLINQIVFLESQIDAVSKEIKELYNKLDSHLLSVPGIGDNLAPIILAEIGDINNFDKPSKLIAFAGTDPSENQSGNKLSSNDKTSKRGSPYLRHAIYTASLVAISNEPELRAYYDKKISEGKHHFVALAGISRKLLTIIYYILKEDRDYIRYDNIKDKLN
ncbi:MAG: IS110 family transposase [Bacilli bacterium]|jgi:transposase|nr:IS110 family transposase [Bacilli bacterium]